MPYLSALEINTSWYDAIQIYSYFTYFSCYRSQQQKHLLLSIHYYYCYYCPLPPIYRKTCVRHYHQLRTKGFCWTKFHCLHVLADSSYCIQIREKTLEASSTVSPAVSPNNIIIIYLLAIIMFTQESIIMITITGKICTRTIKIKIQ